MDEKIKNTIKNFLEKYKLLKPEDFLLVAFSGGVDSLCLLDVLNIISKEHKFKLIAAHLNHNWRGEESRIEQKRAKEYCVSRKIDFCTETLPEGLSHTELEARDQRYAFLNRVAKKFNTTGILTGHTSTDQIETVLYRIIKGTGVTGLTGIPEVRCQEDAPPIYRPILAISREETTNYCKENNLSPNLDSSNKDEKFLRNRIRLSLIPELKTYNSNINEAILRLSDIAKDTEDIVDKYLKEIKNGIYSNNEEIKANKFLKLSRPLQKRVILDLLSNRDIEYDYKKIDEILDFIKESSKLKSGNTLSLTIDNWLFVSVQIIKVIHEIRADVIKSTIIANLNGTTYFSGLNKTVKITPWKDEKPKKFPEETSNTAYVDLSLVEEPIYLRTRQEGDIIQPFGMLGKMKLKKYLINKGVPEFKRDKLLLLANDKEIIWVVGVGISELIRVKDIPTHILQVE